MSKIIVAGGGHGGIATAAQLAQAGYDVTVYEKKEKGTLGYDWVDSLDPKSFLVAGIPAAPEGKFVYKPNMTFLSNSQKTPVVTIVPDDPAQKEIRMERRDIYAHIIAHAENCGVKFEYGVVVKGPVMAGDRVVGLETDQGAVYGDLIIDACGVNSPVRANLPDVIGIQKHAGKYEKLYAYRGTYNLVDTGEEIKNPFSVVMLPGGTVGIGWATVVGDQVDYLLGRFDPITQEDIESTADFLRETRPWFGTELQRGGQVAELALRQPLALFVADGYAAIGDSAFMTIPIVGSGMANSFRASKMLADTVINDSTQTFSAETLWPYEVEYFQKIGNENAPTAAVKLLLTRVTAEQLDYCFDRRIITEKEMSRNANDDDLGKVKIDAELLARGKAIVENGPLSLILLRFLKDTLSARMVVKFLPKTYSRSGVLKWAAQYEAVFRPD